MDGYPAGSLDHNVPFLVVAGLSGPSSSEASADTDSSDQAILVESEIPCVEGKDAEVLVSYLASVDGRRPPWSARSKDKLYKYRVKTVGRVRNILLWLAQILTLYSRAISHRDERVSQEIPRKRSPPQSSIRPFLLSLRLRPSTRMVSSTRDGFISIKSMCQACFYAFTLSPQIRHSLLFTTTN
jgi:hypothetical protein